METTIHMVDVANRLRAVRERCAIIAKIQIGESVTSIDAPGTIYVGVDKQDETTHYVWVSAGTLPTGDAECSFPNAVDAYQYATHIGLLLVCEEFTS